MSNQKKPIKLTVGDMSHVCRNHPTFSTTRHSLWDIPVGETVLVRFKDEVSTTQYRPYRLERKFFKDEIDNQLNRPTGTFRRIEEAAI